MAHFPNQMMYWLPLLSDDPAPPPHPRVLADRAQAKQNRCLPQQRSFAPAPRPLARTSSATLHAAPRSDPTPDEALPGPLPPSAANPMECDRPRLLPPSAPKTITAVAHMTTLASPCPPRARSAAILSPSRLQHSP